MHTVEYYFVLESHPDTRYNMVEVQGHYTM